jgi:hypothetical protein
MLQGFDMIQAKELMIDEFELASDNSAEQIELDHQAIGYEAAYVPREKTNELPF